MLLLLLLADRRPGVDCRLVIRIANVHLSRILSLARARARGREGSAHCRITCSPFEPVAEAPPRWCCREVVMRKGDVDI
jgi:hypothetical protein